MITSERPASPKLMLWHLDLGRGQPHHQGQVDVEPLRGEASLTTSDGRSTMQTLRRHGCRRGLAVVCQEEHCQWKTRRSACVAIFYASGRLVVWFHNMRQRRSIRLRSLTQMQHRSLERAMACSEGERSVSSSAGIIQGRRSSSSRSRLSCDIGV